MQLNLTLFGMLIFIVLPGFVAVGAAYICMRGVRRLYLARQGRCVSCGYPRSHSAVCTECGSDFKTNSFYIAVLSTIVVAGSMAYFISFTAVFNALPVRWVSCMASMGFVTRSSAFWYSNDAVNKDGDSLEAMSLIEQSIYIIAKSKDQPEMDRRHALKAIGELALTKDSAVARIRPEQKSSHVPCVLIWCQRSNGNAAIVDEMLSSLIASIPTEVTDTQIAILRSCLMAKRRIQDREIDVVKTLLAKEGVGELAGLALLQNRSFVEHIAEGGLVGFSANELKNITNSVGGIDVAMSDVAMRQLLLYYVNDRLLSPAILEWHASESDTAFDAIMNAAVSLLDDRSVFFVSDRDRSYKIRTIVRNCAGRNISRLGNMILNGSSGSRVLACWIAGTLEEAAHSLIPQLQNASKDSDNAVSQSAARALARILKAK